MDIEVLNTLYRILKNTAVTRCELQRPELFISMRLSAQAEATVEERAPAASVAVAEPVEDKPEFELIKSGEVGLFHAAKQPLKPGDEVKKGQVVGTIESMGIAQNVVSQVSGKIMTQKVRNKEPVEYGEVIFEVEKE
jgi:acetyl-CoA carboxylase biotin carboxyl carrier protein